MRKLRTMGLLSASLLSTQVILALIFQLLAILFPFFEGEIINAVTIDRSISKFYMGVACLIFLGLVKLISSYFSNRIHYVKLTAFSYQVQEHFIKRLTEVAGENIRSIEGAYLHTRIAGDIDTVFGMLYSALPEACGHLLLIGGVMMVIYAIMPAIALIFLGLCLIYTLVYAGSRGKLYSNFHWVRECRDHYFSKLNSIFNRLFTIKGKQNLGTELSFVHDDKATALQAIEQDFILNFRLSSFKVVVIMLAQMTCFILGGQAVIQQNLTIGHFVILTQYFALLIASIEFFFNLSVSIQEFKVAQGRLGDLFALPLERVTSKPMLREIRQIEIDAIAPFDDFHLSLGLGQCAVLTGENGAGKTTLILSLLGLLQPQERLTSKWNGIAPQQLDMPAIRAQHLSLMFQQEELADISLARYFCTYENQCEALGLLDEYWRRRDYFNEHFFDFRGKEKQRVQELSGGERQCFGILLTLLKVQSSVLIFDEPFSNLAQPLAWGIFSYLKRLAKEQGLLVLIISHDRQIIKSSDLVYTFNMMQREK